MQQTDCWFREGAEKHYFGEEPAAEKEKPSHQVSKNIQSTIFWIACINIHCVYRASIQTGSGQQEGSGASAEAAEAESSNQIAVLTQKIQELEAQLDEARILKEDFDKLENGIIHTLWAFIVMEFF